MGTNWHALQQVYRNTLRDFAMFPGDQEKPLETVFDLAFQAAVDHLNKAYEVCPASKSITDWAVERQILASSFAGYVWYYQADTYETLATEIAFELPVYHPKAGMPLPTSEVLRVGKIDRVVRYGERIMPVEYKSTSKSIDPDSTYWNHLNLDTQVSMYVAALEDLHAAGSLASYGIQSEEPIIGCLYDVWHKPTISPKMLTQKDTAELIATGKYMGVSFDAHQHTPDESNPDFIAVVVDGVQAEVEMGKKGFAIRETPEMFGARLLADIYERPTFYFARREITRTSAELQKFRTQLYNIYQSIKTMDANGHYFQNEQNCEATFKCSYTSICYAGKEADVIAGETPAGYRRIFTDITIGDTE